MVHFLTIMVVEEKQAKETSEKEEKELIIFFGDGTFKVGGKGYSCIPKKKFIKTKD